MSRESLIKQFKKINPNISDPEISQIIDCFCGTIKNSLKNNKNVELRGFGTFFIKKIKEKYSARNPRSGELIYVPEKNKVRFKISKILNYKLND